MVHQLNNKLVPSMFTMVLFTGDESHQAAGDYVSFVLWLNSPAGFAYYAAGIRIWLQRSWAALPVMLIAVFTVLAFIALGVHIYAGGAYEIRTVTSISMRSIVWIGIALITYLIDRHQEVN